MSNLFRKKMDPRCVYCKKGTFTGNNEVICDKHGIVEAYSACRSFSYDPLKRVPPPQVTLKRDYKPEDFDL